MIAGSIARRYAKALLSIGIDKKMQDRFGTDIEQFSSTLASSKELRDVLHNPTQPLSRRKAIVDQIVKRLRPHPTVQAFLLLLMDRNRIDAMPSIAREYQGLLDQFAGRVRARVTSAQKLDPATEQRLKKALEQRTGKQVILELKTDPELIGGLVTQIGSILYDGSIRTSLEQMRQSLLQGEE